MSDSKVIQVNILRVRKREAETLTMSRLSNSKSFTKYTRNLLGFPGQEMYRTTMWDETVR